MITNLKDQDLALVITTESNYDNAKKLAQNLLSKKLAACISFVQIKSLYCWNNEILEELEVQLNIKVKANLVDKLYYSLKEIHSYKLPQFICIKASSSEEYFKWCSKNI